MAAAWAVQEALAAFKRQSIYGRTKPFGDRIGYSTTAERQSNQGNENTDNRLRHNKSELDCKRHGVGEVATAVQKQRSGKGRYTRRRVLASLGRRETTEVFRAQRSSEESTEIKRP